MLNSLTANHTASGGQIKRHPMGDLELNIGPSGEAKPSRLVPLAPGIENCAF